MKQVTKDKDIVKIGSVNELKFNFIKKDVLQHHFYLRTHPT